MKRVLKGRRFSSGPAGIRAADDRQAGASPHRFGPALEEVPENVNGIGEVDGLVAIEVHQLEVGGIRYSSVAAGQLRGRAEEEMAQEADSIGDVQAAVLVAVTVAIAGVLAAGGA